MIDHLLLLVHITETTIPEGGVIIFNWPTQKHAGLLLFTVDFTWDGMYTQPGQVGSNANNYGKCSRHLPAWTCIPPEVISTLHVAGDQVHEKGHSVPSKALRLSLLIKTVENKDGTNLLPILKDKGDTEILKPISPLEHSKGRVG